MSADGRRPEALASATQAGGEYHPPPNASDDPRMAQIRPLIGLDPRVCTPHPPNATDPWLLGCRVDALVVAYRLDSTRLNRTAEDRLRLAAQTAGPVELARGPVTVSLRSRPDGASTLFENADLRGTLNWRATGGWHIEVVARATFLATHTLDRAIEVCGVVAQSFAPVAEGPRLRRVDLAADFAQFRLDAGDRDRLATTRCGITEFSAEGKDVDEVRPYETAALRMHLSGAHKVTGFSIALGNPISARIYDKTAELRCPGREGKRAIEHALWVGRGWNESGPVVRVEFQLRSTFLDEVAGRDACELSTKLDGLWQRCVQWLRMIEPGSASRPSRCALDPRWEAVRAVVFEHKASPIPRARKRGGASAGHTLGAVISHQGSSGALKRIDPGCDAHGVVLDEMESIGRLTDEQAEQCVRDYISELFAKSAGDVSESLAVQIGWRKTATLVLTRNNAAIARFSSIDDRPPR